MLDHDYSHVSRAGKVQQLFSLFFCIRKRVYCVKTRLNAQKGENRAFLTHSREPQV